jgi:lysozyme
MEPINVVIDLSHWNNVANFTEVKNDGIVGIIHKATQGFGYTDPTYLDRRKRALDAGLLWGSYHFGVGGEGVAQIQHFLDFVKPGPHDLLVLDLEGNPAGSSMTIDEAEEFMHYIYTAIGRWPGLYSGYYIKEKLGFQTNTILTNCWLWLAQYGPVTVVPRAWPTWTMWQYTDGAVGPEPHVVAGIGYCDRDKFNGDLTQLHKLWGFEE